MRAYMIDRLHWVRGQWRVQYKVPERLWGVAKIKTQTEPTGIRGAKDDEAMKKLARERSGAILIRMRARRAAWEHQLDGNEPITGHYTYMGSGRGFDGMRIRRGEPSPNLVPFDMGEMIAYRQPTAEEQAATAVSFDSLVDRWAARRGTTSPKARQAMSRCMNKLAVFLGHSDASRVKADDLAGFPDWLLKSGLKPKTVGDDYVPAVKTILALARPNDSPARNLMFVGHTNPEDERRDFTSEERAMILRAALASDDPVIKWANLISAYSGARLAEIVEAHKRDVEVVDEVAMFHVRLDNRQPGQRLKNKASARPFPIHPAVIGAGFMDYVTSLPDGPLFPDAALLDKHGRRNTKASDRIMKWLRREVGITDTHADFHSHRHGFKTLCCRYGIEEQYADAIAGHSNGSIGRTYGYYPPAVLAREIEKIPG